MNALTLAALRVLSAQAKEARLALVAPRPLDVGLAAALTALHAEGRVGVAVAHAPILRAIRVAVARCGTDRLGRGVIRVCVGMLCWNIILHCLLV